MIKPLERNSHIEVLIFDDGVQMILAGERWPDDTEGERLAEETRDFINSHFLSSAKYLTKGGVRTNALRIHDSVMKFDERFASVWDNKAAMEAFKANVHKQFIIPIETL